jgi:hypothetical protein
MRFMSAAARFLSCSALGIARIVDRFKPRWPCRNDLRSARLHATLGAISAKKDATMLDISPRKVVHVIFQAREGRIGEAEVHAFIDALNDDEKASLVAIAWVGRGAFEPEDYAEALATARAEATTPTADYLMGMPHLAENLEYGLDALGIDVTDAEEDFL